MSEKLVRVLILMKNNRSLESFADLRFSGQPIKEMIKGSAGIAINEWLSQFNVRMAQIEAPAGMETKIIITPSYRSASPSIKALEPTVRHCRFIDEVKVS